MKTSVIFAIRRHHGWTEGRTMKENFMTYEDGNFTGPIGKEFYVHSGGFKRIFQKYLEIQRATIPFHSRPIPVMASEALQYV